MDKIASFQINHLLLNPGIYVSRKDKAGDKIKCQREEIFNMMHRI